MTKRLLPARSTRGQLPHYLRQSPSPVRNRTIPVQDEGERQKKQAQTKRKSQQLANLKKYPYCRAVHYFIDLDQLSRASQTVSYAILPTTQFGFTFSKDYVSVRHSLIKDLINRSLIGLPFNQNGLPPTRKQNKCKNVCYSYLFEIEDKKHNNDRIIFTIKNFLKYPKRYTSKQYSKFDFVRKDGDLQLLLEDQISCEQKKRILEQKLVLLTQRKDQNSANWLFEDTVLFHHALNQKLHNSVVQLKNKLSEDSLLSLLFQKEILQYQFYHSSCSIQEQIFKLTKYYFTNMPALSQRAVKSLVNRFKTSLVCKGPKDQFFTQYPAVILQFGKDQILHTLTQFLLGRRAYALGQTHFYEVKSMIRRLFGRDLKVKSQRPNSYQHYYKQFRRRYDDILRFRSKIYQQQEQHYCYPLLDDRINEGLAKTVKKLFKISEIIPISKRQFQFVMIYYWLAQSIAHIYPYLIQFHDLLDIIGSDFYPKICNSLVQALGSPEAGLIFYTFEALTQLMGKIQPLPTLQHQLFLQFDLKTNVCLIWREPSQATQSQSCEKVEDSRSKKVKRK